MADEIVPGPAGHAFLEAAHRYRRQRRHQLERLYSPGQQPTLPPPRRPDVPFSVRSLDSDAQADALIEMARIQHGAAAQTRSFSLRKTLGIAKKPDTPPPWLVSDVLYHHVTTDGLLPVTETLLARLVAAGGDANAPDRVLVDYRVLDRPRLDLQRHGRFLQYAMERLDRPLVQLLVPLADTAALDDAAVQAVELGRTDFLELLLAYGAQLARTAAGREAFARLCAEDAPANSRMLELVLVSAGRPPAAAVEAGLALAAQRGRLDTVRRMCRLGVDDAHAALAHAVHAGHPAMAGAIVFGEAPQDPEHLDAALTTVLRHHHLPPATAETLLEILLCAGATEAAAEYALSVAIHSNDTAKTELLVRRGTALDHDDADALAALLSVGAYDRLAQLLESGAPLNAANASRLAARLPIMSPDDDFQRILAALLDHGADGEPLAACLANAVDDQNTTCIALIADHVAAREDVAREAASAQSAQPTPPLLSLGQYNTLKTALVLADAEIFAMLLRMDPGKAGWSLAFDVVMNEMVGERRAKFASVLLRAGLPQTHVDFAFDIAIGHQAKDSDDADPKPPGSPGSPDDVNPDSDSVDPTDNPTDPTDNDTHLLDVLLASGRVDVNTNPAQYLVAFVRRLDFDLVARLLATGRASAATSGLALEEASRLRTSDACLRMARIVLDAGAVDADAAARALARTMRKRPLAWPIIKCIVESNNIADINAIGGVLLRTPIYNSSKKLLDYVLANIPGEVSNDTGTRALAALAKPYRPTTPERETDLLTTLLTLPHDKDVLGLLLERAMGMPARTLAGVDSPDAVQLLLDAGADLNANGGALLCSAVVRGRLGVVERMVATKTLTSASVRAGLEAITGREALDKTAVEVANVLLDAAALTDSDVQASFAHIVRNSRVSQNGELGRLFAGRLVALGSTGRVLLKAILATDASQPFKEDPADAITALFSLFHFHKAVLGEGLAEALDVADVDLRRAACRAIMQQGPETTDDNMYCMFERAVRINDHDIVRSMTTYGRIPNAERTLPVAVKQRSVEVVETILAATRSPDNAYSVDDLLEACIPKGKPRLDMCRAILAQGVSLGALHAALSLGALHAALRRAPYPHPPLALAELVMRYNACPGYDRGDMLVSALAEKRLDLLRVYLRITPEGKYEYRDDTKPAYRSKARAARPTQYALRRVYDTMVTDSLYDAEARVVPWLFTAGFDGSDVVDSALLRLVNRPEQPDSALVRLYLGHGASPTADACAVVSACVRFAHVDALKLILASAKTAKTRVSGHDLDTAIARNMHRMASSVERSDVWLDRDVEMLELLMDEGANAANHVRLLQVFVQRTGYGPGKDAVAKAVKLLVNHGAPVGAAFGTDSNTLGVAARNHDVKLLHVMLHGNTNLQADDVNTAFPHLFDRPGQASTVHDAIAVMRKAQDAHGKPLLDPLFPHEEPFVHRAMLRYGHAKTVMRDLADLGFPCTAMVPIVPSEDEARSTHENVPLLAWAILYPGVVSRECLSLFIDKRNGVDTVSSVTLRTPLMFAVEQGNVDVVRALAAVVEEAAAVDMDGMDALQLAMGMRKSSVRLDMVHAISSLAHNQRHWRQPHVHDATLALDHEALGVLLDNKFRPDIPNTVTVDGRDELMTPLAALCRQAGRNDLWLSRSDIKAIEACVRLLLLHGADMFAKTQGKTPLVLALESRHPEDMVRLLLRTSMGQHVGDPRHMVGKASLLRYVQLGRVKEKAREPIARLLAQAGAPR